MAEKASADRVAADMRPANYRGAVQLIRHAIQKKKEQIQGINQRIGEDWGKVEGNKVSKKAGRLFQMLDKLEHEERVEIMRDLNGLIDSAGWDETAADLVDAAQDNVVHLRVGGQQDGDGDGGEDAGTGDDGEAELNDVEQVMSEPAKPRRGRPKKAVPIPAVPTGEAKPEAYTGDNSDLNPE